MARHRNIRNLKNLDYDDDYDIYGQSYEDTACVSPGTVEHYMYPRTSGKNMQLSSYIPSEQSVEEEHETADSYMFKCDKKSSNSSNTKVKDNKSNLKVTCIKSVQDVIGEYYPLNHIEETASKFGFNAEKTISFLLDSGNNSIAVQTEKVNQTPLNNTPPRQIPTTNLSKPQRGARGRRSKFTEKNSGTAENLNSSIISISGSGTDIVKVKTSSNTPVKTGFHLSSNSRFEKDNKPNGITIEIAEENSPSPQSKTSRNLIDYQKEYDKRTKCSKQQISMVVIGHVDAGKSTMMGHLLFQKGIVSKRIIHKHEQESKKAGKSSFAFAWVLDETGEERERGVTMDVAHNYFETDNRVVTLMDAPGHRDFIPNMITGASQADVAVLVVGATTGEFEAGFGVGGQTREHALLVRSLGVSQLAVAINKLDIVKWSKERFDEIVQKLKLFLKQAGFRETDVTFIPVSGLLGENLTKPSKEPLLCKWYKGPYLLQVIDNFRPPQRPIDFPFRFCVNDVYRSQGSGIYVSGKVESGGVCPNTKVMVMPAGEKGIVKTVESNDDKGRLDFALSGEHAVLILNGVEMNKINKGSVICDIDRPIKAVTKLQARVIIFNIEVPITKGFPIELHYKAVSEPAFFKKLLSVLHKSTGEILIKKPRVLKKNQNALVEIETARAVCLEVYGDLKELGRCTLRYGGSTIAACLVTKLL